VQGESSACYTWNELASDARRSTFGRPAWEDPMITYVLIAVLAVLIFLSIPDVVEVIGQATYEWERAKDLSKKNPAR